MLKKLTTVMVVDSIEAALPTWERLGYTATLRVPEIGTAGFTILTGPPGELMLQTRASLADDLPAIAQRAPAYVLYGEVASLEAAKGVLRDAKVIVPHRKTFYGAEESWLELAGGVFLGLSKHAE